MTFNQYLKAYCGISLKEFIKLPSAAKKKTSKDYKHSRYISIPKPVIEKKDTIDMDEDLYDELPDESDTDYWMSYMAEMGYPVDEFNSEPIGW